MWPAEPKIFTIKPFTEGVCETMNYSISGVPWQSKDQDVVLSLPWAWVQALVEGTKIPLSHVAQPKKKRREYFYETNIPPDLGSSQKRLRRIR